MQDLINHLPAVIYEYAIYPISIQINIDRRCADISFADNGIGIKENEFKTNI